MPKFNVNMTKMPWLEVGKSPVIFHVEQGPDKLGIIKIKKGHIVWVPEQGKQGYWLDWNKFSKVMAKNGKKRPAGY